MTDDRERWDRRYQENPDRCGTSHRTILDLARPLLPETGRAVDVACGTGHNAVRLAQFGLDVLAVDVSGVALELVQANAKAARVKKRVKTLRHDVLQGLDGASKLDGPFDVVTMSYFHAPTLLPELARRLAPGGVLIAEVPNVGNIALGHERPPPAFLWEHRELLVAARGLHVDLFADALVGDRAVSRLIARRDPDPTVRLAFEV